MSVGIMSSATSRFVVEVDAMGAYDGTVQALQLAPGPEGQRLIKFQFTDVTSGRAFGITIAYAEAALEVFDVFGGKKEAGDQADKGAY